MKLLYFNRKHYKNNDTTVIITLEFVQNLIFVQLNSQRQKKDHDAKYEWQYES